MSRRCGFFATRSDLLSLFERVEAKASLHYVRTGLFDNKSMKRIVSARYIEHLGIALVGDRNHVPSYLIINAKSRLDIREVPQRRGGVKYAVDQRKNPKSIALNPGGEFDGGAIIEGQVGTVSRDSDSLSLFTLVSKELKREFTIINGMYIGKEAIKAMDSGVRLTANVRSPPEYDLRRISDGQRK